MNTKIPSNLLYFFHYFLKGFYNRVLAYAIAAVGWAFVVAFARPKLVQWIINTVAETPKEDIIRAMQAPVFFYMSMLIFRNIIGRQRDYIYLCLIPPLKARIIERVVDYVEGQSYHYFQNNLTGVLANRINNIKDSFSEIIQLLGDKFIGNITAFIFGCITLYLVHPILVMILIIWTIFYLFLIIWSSHKARIYSYDAGLLSSQVTGYIVDVLTNIVNVKIFGRKEDEMNILRNHVGDALKADQKLRRFIFKVGLIQGILVFILIGSSLAFLIYARSKDQVRVGDFGLVFVLFNTIIEIIWFMSIDIQKFSEHLGILKQGISIVTTPYDRVESPLAKPIKVTDGQITFKNVSFHYAGQKKFFDNLNVEIKPGEKVGLVGYSGSGKTTFVNLILRLFDIRGGQILIDGQDIQDCLEDSLRNQISLIPQDPILFHRSIWDNLKFANQDSTEEEILEAAKKSSLDNFIFSLKNGFQTIVGERGVKLSGGQKQRISIARSMLKKAKILILDEATSALDSVTESCIHDYIYEEMKDKTTLIIAHRLSTLRQVKRILVFSQGKIIQDGPFEELVKIPGVFQELWQHHVDNLLSL